MTSLNPSYKDTHQQQNSTNNPALNNEAFDRAVERGGGGEKTMSAMGAYLKTGFLLLLTILTATWGWNQVEIVTVMGAERVIAPNWMFLAYIGTFILAIMAIFAGRMIWLVSIAYALAFGAILGVTSHYYNIEWDGIVLQAIVATLTVFAATWLLYITGIIKPSGKLAMFVTIGMIAVALIYSLSWFLSLFGIYLGFLYQPTWAGIGFAALVVLLGALNLPLDFNFIKMASERGAPKYMEWYGAYGLMLSIIWMYISLLRLLALLRSR